ncbi:MAG: hypothetical protein IJR14_03010 [Synergistaceae bacterium]|nr:hypothetical protein [Synergistaceae bacterium]
MKDIIRFEVGKYYDASNEYGVMVLVCTRRDEEKNTVTLRQDGWGWNALTRKVKKMRVGDVFVEYISLCGPFRADSEISEEASDALKALAAKEEQTRLALDEEIRALLMECDARSPHSSYPSPRIRALKDELWRGMNDRRISEKRSALERGKAALWPEEPEPDVPVAPKIPAGASGAIASRDGTIIAVIGRDDLI